MWHFVTCFPLFKTQVQGWPQDGYQCALEPKDVDEIRTWNSAPSKGLCDSGLFFTFWQRILSTCSEILTPSLVHKWMIINDHRIPKVIHYEIRWTIMTWYHDNSESMSPATAPCPRTAGNAGDSAKRQQREGPGRRGRMQSFGGRHGTMVDGYCWIRMFNDDLWWLMMIYDHCSWFSDGFTMINDDCLWFSDGFMMINDDLWSLLMVFWWFYDD